MKVLKRKLPDIFEKVKSDVKKVLKRHRARLNLGLVKIGKPTDGFIGGLHMSPGNDIYMNETALEHIIEGQPKDIVRAYAYHILLYEYIHSLGILEEKKCREITLHISKQVFKKGDPALILAENGIGINFPNLKMIYAPPELNPYGLSEEYIKDFDRESQTYFS
ncbi:MAG: hypothetical protein ACFE8P_11300 [Promethearchaeota archaeon]